MPTAASAVPPDMIAAGRGGVGQVARQAELQPAAARVTLAAQRAGGEREVPDGEQAGEERGLRVAVRVETERAAGEVGREPGADADRGAQPRDERDGVHARDPTPQG